MIIVLAAVELIEQFDCFAGPARVNYNKNLHQATVTFDLRSDSQCYFPKEVQLTLNFHDGFQPQSYVFDNFSITETRQIVMKNIEIVDNVQNQQRPRFSFLNISCLSHFTLLKVSSFALQTSQMDQCFDQSGSRMQIATAFYFFEVKLTDACEEEILQAQQYQIQFGSLANTRDIDLTSATPNCQYNTDTRIFRCDRSADLTDQMQLPFLSSKLVFYMTLNGIKHTAEITFENVETGRFTGLLDEAELHLYQDVAQLRISVNQTVAALFNELTDSQTDIALFRLSARHVSTGTTYKFQLELPTFDADRYGVYFKCETQDCRNYLQNIRKNISAYRYQFDITRLAAGKFSTIASQYVNAVETCMSSGYVAITGKQSYCFEFYIDQKCRLTAGSDVQVTGVFINQRTGKRFVDEDVNATIKYDGQNSFCLQCEEPECSRIHEIGNGRHLQFIAVQGDTRIIGYITKTEMHNYSTTLITVCVFGAAIIGLCLFDSVQKMVLFVRIAKASKKRRD